MLDCEYKHNFHTHTFRCKHAKGETYDYCRYAIKHGMKTLGFSDHSALPDNRWNSTRMRYEELQGYVNVVNSAKEQFPELRVVLGMECEYIPEFHSFFEDDLLGKYNFEYLIGGPHFFTDDYGVWQGTYGGTVNHKSLSEYGRYVVSMVDSGLFDFIAHPDLFGNCYAHWDAGTIACSRDILAAAEACDVGLEINALGLRKIANKQPDNPFPLYPWLPFWELASEYDVKVIVSADAHRPQDLQGLAGLAEAIRVQCGLNAMDPEGIGTKVTA